MVQKWKTGRVALAGAVAGMVYAAAQGATGASAPQGGAHLVGLVAGGAIGGALIFGVVAVIRNAAGR